MDVGSVNVYVYVCILVNEQLGFRSQSSTEMVSYNLITEILNALNNKKKWLEVFSVI